MKGLDSQKSVEVYRRGHSLVASFHRAEPPLIWRFDLERNHSFTLALQGDDNEWELGLTSPKGDFHPIAHFVMRDDAEEAFVKVETALSKPSHHGLLWIAKLCAIFLTVIVLGIIFIAVHRYHADGSTSASDITLSSRPSTLAEPKSGVPVSADDVLRPPGN